jgi:hypothetical protein
MGNGKFKNMKMMRWLVILAVAGLCAFSAVAQDRQGALVRYRSGSTVTLDATSRLQDEDGFWSLGNKQLGKLSVLQAGTATFADFTVQATVTVTNAPAAGQYLAVNGVVRTWADTVASAASQVATGTNTLLSSTNLFLQVSNYAFAGITVSQGSNAVVLTGFTNLVMNVQPDPKWGSVSYSTNTVTTKATVVFSPAYSSAPAVVLSAGTNDSPYLVAVTTNYAVLGARTNSAVINWMAIGPP